MLNPRTGKLLLAFAAAAFANSRNVGFGMSASEGLADMGSRAGNFRFWPGAVIDPVCRLLVSRRRQSHSIPHGLELDDFDGWVRCQEPVYGHRAR
jgi:hypothetical protein